MVVSQRQVTGTTRPASLSVLIRVLTLTSALRSALVRMRVSVLLVRALVEALERANVAPESLLGPSSIDRGRLERIDERFELEEFAVLQERAATLAANPALGLHIGEQVTETAFDSLGYLAGHAPTLREAVTVISRFAALALEGAHLALRESVGVATIHYMFPRASPVSDRMLSEFVMAGLLRLARRLAGASARASVVSFEHSRPPYHAKYTRMFDGAERFAQPSTFIAFEREILDRRQLHQSPHLYEIVRAEAERKLHWIAGNPGPTERLRRYLRAHRVAQMPDMATAARDLGMSERTLRRQLASERTSYREIVRATLEDCAEHLLRDPPRSRLRRRTHLPSCVQDLDGYDAEAVSERPGGPVMRRHWLAPPGLALTVPRWRRWIREVRSPAVATRRGSPRVARPVSRWPDDGAGAARSRG
jgi:AraC-like DNA-binding protein